MEPLENEVSNAPLKSFEGQDLSEIFTLKVSKLYSQARFYYVAGRLRGVSVSMKRASDRFTKIPPYKRDSKWYSRAGYYYVACRSRGASVSMRCASDRCPAHWTLRKGKASPVVGKHNHERTPWVPSRNAMFQALKRRSISEDTALSTIYEEEADRFPDGAPHLPFDSVVSSMRKWRKVYADF